MSNTKVISKLRKIYELALNGVGGEKENAERLLTKLLRKHEMTIDHLAEEFEPVYEYYFPFKDEFERILLGQVICKVCDSHTYSYRSYNKRKSIFIEVTPSQFFEIDMLYGLYKTAWAKELQATISAFISVNEIFPESENPNPREDSEPMSDEDLERLWAKMSGMRPIPIHKMIGN
ncbi:hypothetical protein [Yersinia ruckeri]|uniref:hypothetical protein n=1 Tax=Yersinia ruckeri TaxID=29486 RepID=UPI0022371970|nr:hypothetical protein [Yersinia ruckeri]MCW6598705.1 hypothetical protein [Yersinia ruckeri]